MRTYARDYPFGWLGILAAVAPSSDELIYAHHERGFALHSLRSPELSRLYVQCRPDEDIGEWPDERIWEELQLRLGLDGWTLAEGPVLEKGVTGMRSFVTEPMRYGRLYLAGDAAHIVPPTGAKGLNLAIADVRILAEALASWHATGSQALLDAYSETCLRRVWRAEHFSWWMTSMLHRSPDGDPFEQKLQLSQLRNVVSSRAAATVLAENYVGLGVSSRVRRDLRAPGAARRARRPRLAAGDARQRARAGPGRGRSRRDPGRGCRGDRRRAVAPTASTATCIAQQGRGSGNPAEPLVRALRAAVGGEAAGYVHYGATSQDIVDTAAMLVSRRALELVLEDVARVTAACAALADSHRATPMVARTLLQQALPTMFGSKAATWLVGVLEARRLTVDARDRLAVQLGGAAGTLAALGEHGPEVVRRMASELALEEPVLPWHTSRVRVAALGSALATLAGALGKIALDVVLMAQTEVGELSEPAGEGRGGSSTLAHKRNPVGSTLALACARKAQASATLLTGSLVQEHERAAGAWQAEWDGHRRDARRRRRRRPVEHGGGARRPCRAPRVGCSPTSRPRAG